MEQTELRAHRERIVRLHMEAENVHDFETVMAPPLSLIGPEIVTASEVPVRENVRAAGDA